jgi:hypothetical protein
VKVSPGRLPRLLLVAVLAFAPYEARPLLSAAELFRGMAIQFSYRCGAGRIMAQDADRAVLLWSVCGERREARREGLGVAAAVVTGIVLFVASNTLLIWTVTAALRSFGASPGAVANTQFAIVTVRLAVTFWRAVYAYRHDARLASAIPAQAGPRWALDLLAASPEGSGYGRDLVQRFLNRADQADAEVVLHCDARNVAFYRHHGFALVNEGATGDQLLMLRPSASAQRERVRSVPHQQLLGHLKKGQAEGRPARRVVTTVGPPQGPC